MDNNTHLISIIMPCYNSEKFISEAIESVLAQTYQNWEMLIIDDCSTDTSISRINRYLAKDKRIKLFVTKENSKSPVEPRNIGVKNAQGRYIAFLDSDDIWLPTKLDNQAKRFIGDNTAVVFSYYEKISETGNRKNRIIMSPDSVTYDQLLKGNCIGCLTAIYDIEKTGKVFFKHIGHEDYEYWLSILNCGYLARNTNTTEALYRIRKNSISTNKLKSSKWTWYIYRKVVKLSLIQCVYYFCYYIINSLKKYSK